MFKSLLKLMMGLPVLLASLHAGVLTGDLVTVTHFYPDLGTVNYAIGSQVVPTMNFEYPGLYDLVVNDDTITLNAFCPVCLWLPGTFNGPVITDLTNSPFWKVTVNPDTNYPGFDASRVTFDSSHIYINLESLYGGYLALDVAPAPEPATMGIVGLAFLGLGVLGRKRFAKRN